VTAGPDLGRHNAARREIVGYNPQRVHKANTSTSSSVRHSFNGSDVDLNFSSSPPSSGTSYTLASGEGPARANNASTRVNGHTRAGSAGNWGSLPRSSQLAQSAYPHSPSPSEITANLPWSSNELAVGSSRLH